MKRQWYFEAAGTQAGPIDESEVAAKIAGGVLGPDTLVWTNGQKNWMAAKETELAAHLTLRLSADRSTVRGGSGPEAMPSLTSASVDPSVGVRGDRASTGAIVGADPASAAGISSVGIAAHPTSRERERNQHKGNGLLVLGLGLLGIVVFIAVGVLSYEIGVVAGRSNAIGPAETASRPPPDPPTQSLPEAASSLQWPILKPGDWQKDVAQIETLMQSGDLPIEHAFGYPFFTQSDAEAAFQSWKFPLAKILDADTELEDNWVWWVDLIRADLSTAFPPTMDFYFLVQNPTNEKIRAITIAVFDGDCLGTAQRYYNLLFRGHTIGERSGALFSAQLPMLDHLPKTKGEQFCIKIVGAYGTTAPTTSIQRP